MFLLNPGAQLQAEARRVASECTTDALDRIRAIDIAEPQTVAADVHEIRKRCKETRAVARLFAPTIGKPAARCNAELRSAARELASVRDARAVIDTIAAVHGEADESIAKRLDTISRDRSHVETQAIRGFGNGDKRIERATRHLEHAETICSKWKLDNHVESFSPGLRNTYQRANTGLHRARSSDLSNDVHEWRKGVKDLWYQVRLLELAAPSVLGPLAATLGHLAEALGDDHDRSVLINIVRRDRKKYGGKSATRPALRLVSDQQRTIRNASLRLGETLFAETDDAFLARMQNYWRITSELGLETAHSSLR
jgi:CHAD domain-containing protein